MRHTEVIKCPYCGNNAVRETNTLHEQTTECIHCGYFKMWFWDYDDTGYIRIDPTKGLEPSNLKPILLSCEKPLGVLILGDRTYSFQSKRQYLQTIDIILKNLKEYDPSQPFVITLNSFTNGRHTTTSATIGSGITSRQLRKLLLLSEEDQS